MKPGMIPNFGYNEGPIAKHKRHIESLKKRKPNLKLCSNHKRKKGPSQKYVYIPAAEPGPPKAKCQASPITNKGRPKKMHADETYADFLIRRAASNKRRREREKCKK